MPCLQSHAQSLPSLDALQHMLFPNQPFSYLRRFLLMFFTVGSAYAVAMVTYSASFPSPLPVLTALACSW